MRISQEKIDAVLAATDIVEVIGEYVALKKRGSQFFGLCPFHQEKTPSFSVNPRLNIFKCFGCNRGGDVFRFLMEIEGISFPEAVRILAQRAGIPLPEEEDEGDARHDEREQLFHVLRMAARFFYHQLVDTEEGRTRGLYYLMEVRGLTEATIKKFGLGYAPKAWDALLEEAQRAHITPEVLKRAGLVIERAPGHYYDRFRGRVIFPIFSPVGQVIGFGGRVLEADPDKLKYINSPETPVYQKSRVLYGLYQAKQEIRQRGEALLVEGYTDVLALYQAGIRNVVASSGTALTTEQIRLLKRYAPRVVLVYDADTAGMEAMMRGIELLLKEGMGVYILPLPEGQDPDTFVRQEGAGGFRAYMERHREDFIAFRINQAVRQGQWDRPEEQARVIHTLLDWVALIEDEVQRDIYIRRIAQQARVPDLALFRAMEERKQTHVRKQRTIARRERKTAEVTPTPPAEAEAPVALPEEQTLIRLMLLHGEDMVEFVLGHMSLEEFTEGLSRRVVERILRQYEAGTVTREPFVSGQMGQEVQEFVSGLLVARHEPSEGWSEHLRLPGAIPEQDPYEEAADAMRLLKLDRLDAWIAQVRAQVWEMQQRGEDVLSLMQGLQKLQHYRQQVERGAFLTEDPA